jgi:hypothetical protein
MMRTILFKYITILLLAVPVLLTASDGKLKGKYTKEKTIKKEFDVNSDALLKVTNSYGNLNLTSWEGNKVIIEVHIKTNGNNEEKVQKKLDGITVDFDSSSSMVAAKTVFDRDGNRWGWWGNNNNINMQINYTIKLPVKNSVHLNNDYGNIILDRIDGHAKINCDYGRLEIGELRGRNNQLNFDYTSKSTIDFINSGTIDADYSGFTIGKAGDLTINADYTNSTIEKMGNLEYSTDYGKLEVGEADNVKGSGDYIGVKLGILHGNVDITADYGSVKIDKMAADAENLRVNGDYTGIKIGYDPEYHFDFEIKTSYAGVSGVDEFQMNISEVKNTSKYYKGYYGAANSGNSVNISSDYGGITFTRY